MTPAERQAALQLAKVLDRHRKETERNGGAVGEGLAFLEAMARFCVTAGQDGSTFAGSLSRGDCEPVPTLAVTYKQAAAAVNVSEATIKREVRDGRLPTCRVGLAPRIQIDDLKAYLDMRSSVKGSP